MIEMVGGGVEGRVSRLLQHLEDKFFPLERVLMILDAEVFSTGPECAGFVEFSNISESAFLIV